MQPAKLKNHFFLLLIILFLAFLLRFSGISWGLPFSFHPDEWNMAASVARLSWKNNLDPKFYAYNQFPLYLSYFSASLYNLIPWLKIEAIDVSEAIFFLRFWSAVAGVGSIYFIYLISKFFLPENYSFIPPFLAAFTPGLIQISHFGTTESLLSFFFLAILYFSLKILQKPDRKNYLYSALFMGLALATKISALVFITPIFLASVIVFLRSENKPKIFIKFLVFLISSSVLAILLSPYLLLNFQESLRIIMYETEIARGIIAVFYTRQFVNTLPVLFQLQKIFPYALGLPIFISGSIGFLIMLFLLIKNIFKKNSGLLLTSYFLILTSFLVYFLSQAFLFCKWTRFMAPIFAFFPIFTGLFLQKIISLIKNKVIQTSTLFLLLFLSILPGIFFTTIYLKPDIRLTASEWIYKNIPSGAKILSETGNVVDIPIFTSPRRNYSLSPTSFDFYELDQDPNLFPELMTLLENSDYIFIPSRRIFSNYLRLKTTYPLTAKYYELLFSGKLGFTQIKTFSSILNDELAEETWSVFDHPTIRIYKKTVPFSKAQYEELFF